MVRCRDDNAVGNVVLEKLEERVEDAPNLSDFILLGPIGTQGVELVEQVHRARGLHCVKHQSELRSRFTEVLRDQAVKLNAEQRNAQLARQRGCRHRLARAWGTDQEESTHRRKPMRLDVGTVALLRQHALDAIVRCRVERHLGKPRLRVDGSQQAGQLAARLHHGHRSGDLSRTLALDAGLRAIDQIAQLDREAVVSLPSGLGRDLQGDRIEALFVAIGVATDQGFDLGG